MTGDDRPNPETLGEYAEERDMERFWEEIKPDVEPLDRRWFLPAIVVLMIVSVPWYLPEGTVGGFIGGLPSWLWIPLVCSLAIAAITSFVALRSWKDDG